MAVSYVSMQCLSSPIVGEKPGPWNGVTAQMHVRRYDESQTLWKDK